MPPCRLPAQESSARFPPAPHHHHPQTHSKHSPFDGRTQAQSCLSARLPQACSWASLRPSPRPAGRPRKRGRAYVDSNLVGTGMVTSAGIYDLQGNPWAYSAGFAAQVAEVNSVSAAMAADPTALAASGVVVAGVKYMFVSGDANEVYVKKGNGGGVFAKCNTCITVGYHGAPRHQQAPLPIPPLSGVRFHPRSC